VRRVFYDTEFIDNGKTIDLISIGMVDEEGNELYYVNNDCSFKKVLKHKWLRENVLPYLPTLDDRWDDKYGHSEVVKSKYFISREVKNFILGKCPTFVPEGTKLPKYETVELWAYYGAYDHVALAQLWGSMIDLPKGIPMYTHDLKQEMDRLGVKKSDLSHLDKGNEHNALDDAKWNLQLKQFLESLHD
jgi:hypothetical protein